jgi:hypothetical protein
VGDLEFVTAGYKLSAIPEAACRLHSHYKDSTGNQSNDPAYNVVRTVEIHSRNGFFGNNLERELTVNTANFLV